MTQQSFTVLIGSFARGQGGRDSDVDILRIGHSLPVNIPLEVDINAPISYIDYGYSVFMELYREGSLFLLHTFKEGQLLSGDEEVWEKFKRNFVVSGDYKDIINQYCELLKFIGTYPGFENAFMAYLSNIFKALKNIGIFKMAERGKYVFEKKLALIEGCGLSLHQSETLISCNNSFERSRSLSHKEKIEYKNFAQQWKSTHSQLVEKLSHD